MPMRAKRTCMFPGCAALSDGPRCAQHPNEPWESSDRATAAERGYGHAWRVLRARILKRDKYLCQPCLKAGRVTPASAVDHIIPKAKGGTDADENLQSICRPCHDWKTSALDSK
jgi:5-methylcytosine-specific restriction protein A